MEVPRLGVELELQLLAYPQPEQPWILTPLSEAGDRTSIYGHYVRFLTPEPLRELCVYISVFFLSAVFCNVLRTSLSPP